MCKKILVESIITIQIITILRHNYFYEKKEVLLDKSMWDQYLSRRLTVSTLKLLMFSQ